MPNDPIVWVILIVVVGIVVALAIWLGRGISFRKDDKSIAIKVAGAGQTTKASDNTTSVAEKATIENAEVGDIAGAKIRGGDATANDKEAVEVLKGGTVKGSKVGDIVGKKIED